MFEPKYNKRFLKEYDKLCRTHSPMVSSVDMLTEVVLREPRGGIGRPERLKHKVGEMWSRRIDQCNRLVYTIIGNAIYFESCVGHYDDR
jgi:toxin YoeB